MDKDIFRKWLDNPQENPPDEPPMPSSCCGNCRFARRTAQVNQLACTRYPPQLLFMPPNQLMTQFPIVQPRQLCGEWQPQLAI